MKEYTPIDQQNARRARAYALRTTQELGGHHDLSAEMTEPAVISKMEEFLHRLAVVGSNHAKR